MSVGKRVARLRISRGDSLRDAAARTGVSHTTIARIEKGEVTGSLDCTLRSIASGYGVPVEFLLGEEEPWNEFQHVLTTLRPEQRAQLIAASRAERIRMVVDFLAFSYPRTFTLQTLAEASHLPISALQEALAAGHEVPEEIFAPIASGLQRMCGVDPAWLAWGGLDNSTPIESSVAAAQAMGRYRIAVQRAIANGIDPRALEMAVDMLALQSRYADRTASACQESAAAGTRLSAATANRAASTALPAR